MILNGSDTITGDIIIMPIDISTEATTMSMMMKGMKTMKPIWKAVLISEVTKAGMMTRIGRSSALSTGGTLARPAKRSRSGSRTWASMKVRIGTEARCRASSNWIWPSAIGR